MKRLLLVLILPMVLWAQPDFFGYFESEADVMQLGSQRYTFGYNKLRLDVEARPSDNVLIGANINAQQYWGKTNWNIYDFIPGDFPDDLEMIFALPDTMLLDNVYMKIAFPMADLTLGRQQISPGVGYAWNPTDIFNQKSLMDPSYEQTGSDVIRIDLPLDDRSSLIALIHPTGEFENSTKQIALNGGVGSFDFGITATKQTARGSSTPILGESYIKDRYLFGGSIIGELLGWGFWTEFAHNKLSSTGVPMHLFTLNIKIPESYNEYVLGVDHTFDNSVYFMTEYLHNGYGTKNQEDLTTYQYLQSLGGGTHSLMQDYGFFYAMHPTFDYVTLSALVITNFNDNSGTFAPQFDWNAFEDTNISLQGSLFWGEDDTEFGLQDWGVRLRLRSDF